MVFASDNRWVFCLYSQPKFWFQNLLLSKTTYPNTKLSCFFFDRGFVTIIFFILGMGTLLPWNFFITAFDVRSIMIFQVCIFPQKSISLICCLSQYFNERLNTTTSSNVSESHKTDPYMFDNMCVLLSQLPLLLFTFLNSFLYQQ